jgi:hypothetical protein
MVTTLSVARRWTQLGFPGAPPKLWALEGTEE